jgi:hypothetical protein
MNYNQLIETISEIVNNVNICKDNLTLVYELDEQNHLKMDEHLFYKSNTPSDNFIHNEIIELEIGGIYVKFIKKNK